MKIRVVYVSIDRYFTSIRLLNFSETIQVSRNVTGALSTMEQCRDASITIQESNNIDINCAVDDSCHDTLIAVYDSNRLNVSCLDYYACSSTVVNGSVLNEMNFYCNDAVRSCYLAEIYLNYTRLVNIQTSQSRLHQIFKQRAHLINIDCLYFGGCDTTMMKINLAVEAHINCGDSCHESEINIEKVCLLDFRYSNTATCSSTDYKFVDIDMIYINTNAWNCICTNENSANVFLNSTLIVVSHIIKTLDDIVDCSKHIDGNIQVVNYNPNSISVVDIDEIIDDCDYHLTLNPTKIPTYIPSWIPSWSPSHNSTEF